MKPYLRISAIPTTRIAYVIKGWILLAKPHLYGRKSLGRVIFLITPESIQPTQQKGVYKYRWICIEHVPLRHAFFYYANENTDHTSLYYKHEWVDRCYVSTHQFVKTVARDCAPTTEFMRNHILPQPGFGRIAKTRGGEILFGNVPRVEGYDWSRCVVRVWYGEQLVRLRFPIEDI